MNCVSTLELGKRLVELLGLKEGEAVDLAKLANGSVLLRRVEQA